MLKTSLFQKTFKILSKYLFLLLEVAKNTFKAKSVQNLVFAVLAMRSYVIFWRQNNKKLQEAIERHKKMQEYTRDTKAHK